MDYRDTSVLLSHSFFCNFHIADQICRLVRRHTFDQKRLKQPLYRHPWEDVLYTK